MAKKAVIVTGAAGGVGKDAIQALAARGYEVYAGALDDWELGEIEAIKQKHSLNNVHAIVLDNRNHDHMKGLVGELEAQGHRLVGLILNGAAAPMGVPFEHTSVALLRDTFEANVIGNYAAIQCCLPLLNTHEGRVVVVSSATTLAPPPLVIPYVTSKSALNALVHGLRRELRNTNVKLSLLIPGVIRKTYMSHGVHEGSKALLAKIRNCEPSDISEVSYDVGKNTALMQPEGGADPFYEGMLDGQLKTIAIGLTSGGFEPAVVTKDIIKALESARPKRVYYQGMASYVFAVLDRLFPTSWMDWITVKIGYR